MDKLKVIILATDGLTTNMLYHTLSNRFDVEKVIIEQKVSKKTIIKNRIKKVGWFNVLGQLGFMVLVPPLLKVISKNRQQQILSDFKIKYSTIPNSKLQHVDSINNIEIIEAINNILPDYIFVNGTRIISKKIIEGVNCPLINIHTGITPKYRGVHGGYWALANQNPDLFGVTLHFIDAGIDTGSVIDQKVCKTTVKDNFVTYPIIQYAEGLKLIENNNDFQTNTLKQKIPITNESKLHYHPTIWKYLVNRIGKGIK